MIQLSFKWTHWKIIIKVSIVIYNILGQHVKTLVSSAIPEGYYSIQWDGKDEYGKSVSSGVYFYKLQTRGFVVTKKMLFIK